MKDDPVYTATDCFETFPFPTDLGIFDKVGCDYLNTRSQVMIKNDEGMTTTYNRFHDPNEKSAEIKQLRELHEAMDRAVLEAYGWDDLAQTARCEFLLDYEEEDDEPGAKKSKKKKPWRLRWPDEFRDEVLARLLELNEQRAMEEKLAGKTAEAKAKSDGSRTRGRKSSKKKEPGLFKE